MMFEVSSRETAVGLLKVLGNDELQCKSNNKIIIKKVSIKLHFIVFQIIFYVKNHLELNRIG